MRGLVTRVLENLSAFLYPARCGVCQALLAPGRAWCSECWTSLAHSISRPYCPSCCANLGPHQELNSKKRCPQCKTGNVSIPLGGICRLGVYDHSLSRAIRHFKYHSNLHTGNRLGEMLAGVLMEQEWFGSISVLCPVPIHWTRRMTRGFNQAQVLAQRISDETGIPVLNLLRRVRPTVTQVGLPATARAQNLEKAFSVRRSWPLEGTALCLIDDVMTTGSTLFEAARTFHRAGVKKVYAAVVAKADQTGFET